MTENLRCPLLIKYIPNHRFRLQPNLHKVPVENLFPLFFRIESIKPWQRIVLQSASSFFSCNRTDKMPQHPYICYGDALCRVSHNVCRYAGRAIRCFPKGVSFIILDLTLSRKNRRWCLSLLRNRTRAYHRVVRQSLYTALIPSQIPFRYLSHKK